VAGLFPGGLDPPVFGAETMDSKPAEDSAHAEFYLCLSRAFLPPSRQGARQAMAEALPADLQALCEDLGYSVAAHLDGYRDAMAALDGLALLQCYSRLFLSPPAPARINACFYVDGAIMGDSVAELEDWHRHAGVERSESFPDLPDHVSLQLEFAARLFALGAHGALPQAMSARAFLRRFVARWLGAFVADLERAGDADSNPYLHLARVLAEAVARDTARDAAQIP
jgi:TorA maturation chaperone TorD